MKSPQANFRKRRRQAMFAAVLFAVAAVTWWSWPQGDPRFVGTWFVHPEDRPKSENYRLELRSGGLAKMRWEDGRIVLSQWTVSDGELVLGTESKSFFSRLLFAALQPFTSPTFQIRVGRETRYFIGEIRSDRVVLTRTRWQFGRGQRSNEQRTTLTREPK